MSRRRRRTEESSGGGSPEWMTTYGDMVTLLLCFFVLLFSFSEIDARKFKSMIASFQGSLGILDSDGINIVPTDDSTLPTTEGMNEEQIKELLDFQGLQDALEEFLMEKDLEDDILISMDSKGLIMRFQDNVLFDSGRADIKEEAKEILIEIVEFLDHPDFRNKYIRVEGHTDSDPLKKNARYETNWELSTARASNVVRFFIEEMNLDPKRFSASGYSKYHPIAENDTPENKRKNRRVDIVILRSEVITSTIE